MKLMNALTCTYTRSHSVRAWAMATQELSDLETVKDGEADVAMAEMLAGILMRARGRTHTHTHTHTHARTHACTRARTHCPRAHTLTRVPMHTCTPHLRAGERQMRQIGTEMHRPTDLRHLRSASARQIHSKDRRCGWRGDDGCLA